MTARLLDAAGLEVAVSERPSRSTLQITIERDGSITVAVPEGTPDDRVVDFVDRKQDWIHRKLIEKADFLPTIGPKELVDGEGFRYLGRNYRLRLVDEQDVPVRVVAGRLQLRASESDGGAAIRAWYRSRGVKWLSKRLEPWTTRLGGLDSRLSVRDLGYRWGSLGITGQINVHWASLQLPPGLIDYVLVHELSHINHNAHDAHFWRQVAMVMPDYEPRREKLVNEGRHLWLGEVST